MSTHNCNQAEGSRRPKGPGVRLPQGSPPRVHQANKGWPSLSNMKSEAADPFCFLSDSEDEATTSLDEPPAKRLAAVPKQAEPGPGGIPGTPSSATNTCLANQGEAATAQQVPSPPSNTNDPQEEGFLHHAAPPSTPVTKTRLLHCASILGKRPMNATHNTQLHAQQQGRAASEEELPQEAAREAITHTSAQDGMQGSEEHQLSQQHQGSEGHQEEDVQSKEADQPEADNEGEQCSRQVLGAKGLVRTNPFRSRAPGQFHDESPSHSQQDAVSEQLNEEERWLQQIAPPGMQNHINTCYMNAVLQVLFSLQPFISALQALNATQPPAATPASAARTPVSRNPIDAANSSVACTSEAGAQEAPAGGGCYRVGPIKPGEVGAALAPRSLTRALAGCLEELQAAAHNNVSGGARQSFISPLRVKRSMKGGDWKVSTHQQDAHEFMVALMGILLQEVLSAQHQVRTGGAAAATATDTKQHDTSTAAQDPQSQAQQQQEQAQREDGTGVKPAGPKGLMARLGDVLCPGVRTFHGCLQHTYICRGCGHESHTKEQFSHLSLKMPEGCDLPSLRDLLDTHFQDEEVEKTCDACKQQHVTHTVRHQLSRLPPVLALQLKRFAYAVEDGLPRYWKLQTSVSLPASSDATLDLGCYCCPDAHPHTFLTQHLATCQPAGPVADDTADENPELHMPYGLGAHEDYGGAQVDRLDRAASREVAGEEEQQQEGSRCSGDQENIQPVQGSGCEGTCLVQGHESLHGDQVRKDQSAGSSHPRAAIDKPPRLLRTRLRDSSTAVGAPSGSALGVAPAAAVGVQEAQSGRGCMTRLGLLGGGRVQDEGGAQECGRGGSGQPGTLQLLPWPRKRRACDAVQPAHVGLRRLCQASAAGSTQQDGDVDQGREAVQGSLGHISSRQGRAWHRAGVAAQPATGQHLTSDTAAAAAAAGGKSQQDDDDDACEGPPLYPGSDDSDSPDKPTRDDGTASFRFSEIPSVQPMNEDDEFPGIYAAIAASLADQQQAERAAWADQVPQVAQEPGTPDLDAGRGAEADADDDGHVSGSRRPYWAPEARTGPSRWSAGQQAEGDDQADTNQVGGDRTHLLQRAMLQPAAPDTGLHLIRAAGTDTTMSEVINLLGDDADDEEAKQMALAIELSKQDVVMGQQEGNEADDEELQQAIRQSMACHEAEFGTLPEMHAGEAGPAAAGDASAAATPGLPPGDEEGGGGDGVTAGSGSPARSSSCDIGEVTLVEDDEETSRPAQDPEPSAMPSPAVGPPGKAQAQPCAPQTTHHVRLGGPAGGELRNGRSAQSTRDAAAAVPLSSLAHYNLRGAVCHRGRTPFSGHYVAHALLPLPAQPATGQEAASAGVVSPASGPANPPAAWQWWRYDDRDVTPVTAARARQEMGKTGYMLFLVAQAPHTTAEH